MSILHVLKEDLHKEGKDLKIDEFVLNISATDVMHLNNEIEAKISNHRVMPKASPDKTARYFCSL